MFCLPKMRSTENNSVNTATSTVLMIGGIMAIAYYGWKIADELWCKCRCKPHCDCHPSTDTAHNRHPHDHISENDCLDHADKDYYGRCGCFDDGEEETV